MKQRILSVLLALAMVLSLLPMAALAAEGDDTTGDNVCDIENCGEGIYPGPSDLNVEADAGDRQITVTWDALEAVGGVTPTYNVYCYESGKSEETATKITGQQSPYIITGLYNDVTYEVGVEAVYGSEKSLSIETSATPYAEGASAPGAPTNVSAAAGNDGSITVSWKAPTDDGGAAITGYEVDVTYTSEDESVGTTEAVDADVTSCTIEGLTGGVTYTVTVTAINAKGSTASDPTTVTGLPGAPTILSVTPGNGSVTVEWKAPENNGFPEILSYVITAEQNGIGLGDEVEAADDTMSHTLDGLANGNTYQIYVSAVNRVGQGAAATTDAEIPLIPYDLLVGGVAVTEKNMADVLGDGTVSLNPNTITLTLNNAHINVTEGGHGIYSKTFLKLKLIGENSISCSSGYGFYSTDDVTVVGDGSLNVAGKDGGIYIAGGGEVGGLYLKENVSLTVASGNVNSANSYGVRVDDVLEVHDNATLTASAGTALERSCGIYAYDAVNVYDNAVVTTTGTDQSVDQYTDSYGIRTTNMTIKGGTVTATGGAAASSNGIYTQNFGMYGGAVTAVSGSTAGGTRSGPSTALQANRSFFCSGGTVTATSGSAGDDTSCGILVSNGHLVVNGGSLFAQSGKANFSYGIKASQLSLDDGYISAEGAQGVWCSDGISVEGSLAVGDGTILAKAANAETYSYGLQAFDMRISGGEIEAAAGSAANSYGLWAFGNMNLSCNEISLNPYTPGFIGTKVNATAEDGYAIYSRTGVAIADALTISDPEGSSIVTIGGNDELSRYYTAVASDGSVAGNIEIGLLIYKVSIEGLSYSRAALVPAGWSVNETYCDFYEVEDFSEIFDTEKDGYIFLGFFTEEGDEFGFDTEIEEDVTIYAEWKKEEKEEPEIYIPPTYRPTVTEAEGGKVTVSPRAPEWMDNVTITPQPAEGMEVAQVIVTDRKGNPVEVTANGDGTYRFRQPLGKVTITVTFAEKPCDGGEDCPAHGYSDLDSGAWYHEAVDYVLKHQLMGGYGNGLFDPAGTMNRGMMAMLLYNLAGRPDHAYEGAFSDVAEGFWYEDGIHWAAEQDIVVGYNGYFAPDDDITREQMAVMLWRYAGCPESGHDLSAYGDADQISDYARQAMQWANEQGILNGMDGALNPGGTATRAHVAQLLMNFVENVL